ncbi:MAG: GNAT family N-acetyltransferase [Flavobacteriales bacterium]|nr:GNAT family N-acetyltransferase [Flavobacteriales bacterium]
MRTWTIRSFEDLTVQQLHDLLRLRVDVFVVEQHCPYPELDGADHDATHLLLHDASGLVAYARVLPPGTDGLPHIGRVVVRMDRRGQGIASALMQQALTVVEARHGTKRSALAAQAHLERFYAQHGFRRTGADYLLDGIPHVDMRRDDV